MVKKICFGCGRKSYSAAAEGKWICPYCGKDITKAPASPAVDEYEPNENRLSKEVIL